MKRNLGVLVWVFLAGSSLLSGCIGKSSQVTAIAIDPETPDTLYITTNDHVYKTRDGGSNWKIITEGMGHARILSLGIHPSQPATVYAGTLGDSVYRSVDGGNRWSIINAGMKEHVSVVNAFIFYPGEAGSILAATTVGIFKTTDGGLMWEELPNKGMDSVYVVAVAMNPRDSNIFYAGTSGGVYMTVNGSATWRSVNKGLIEGRVGTALSLGVNSLIMDPENPAVLYAGTTKGAYKTETGAQGWTKVQEGMGESFVSAILFHPFDRSILYAGTQSGVFKSTDRGSQWKSVSRGLTNFTVRSLAIHPKEPSILYAGTQGGLFKSVDGAENWTKLNYEAKDSGKKS